LIQNESKNQEIFKEIFTILYCKTIDKSYRFMLFFALQNALPLDLQLFLKKLRFKYKSFILK